MVNLPKNWTPVFGPGASSSKTNTPSTDNSDQARYDRAKASGNTVLANNLAKKLGISASSTQTPSQPTNTPGDTTNQDQANFDAGWSAYTKASTDVFDLETSRQLAKYQQTQQDYQLQQQRNRDDYARYTSNAQAQMNRELASSSKDFSRKLAQAASAYGQRGILRGGIATGAIGESTKDFAENQTYFKTQSQRQIGDQQRNYDQQYADMTKNAGRLQTEQDQYTGDRNVGKEVLKNNLTYQGDSIYNASQASQWQTQQDLLRQSAKNTMYGNTSTPSKRTWRLGGNYSS